MMKPWPVMISGAIVCLVLASALTAWRWVFLRRSSKAPLLPYSPRSAVPWGAIDLVLIILISVVVQTMGMWGWQQWSGVDPAIAADGPAVSLSNLAVFAASSLAALALSLWFVRSRTAASWRDLGCHECSAADVQIGITGFALLTAPVFAIQFVLSQVWQESQHPLIELLQETPSDAFFLVSGFTAIIVAPIVEEFFFRVFLQGWLENMAALLLHQRLGDVVSPAARAALFLGSPRALQEAPAKWDTLQATAAENHADLLVDGGQRIDKPIDVELLPKRWPIITSSALFALAHFGNGPDPVPLFVFALGLGYIYQRTHRVLPCIIVHMLLNGLSMTQLWLYTR